MLALLSPARAADSVRAEKIIVKLTNDFRSRQGRSQLAVNADLTKAAKYFADYLANSGKFSHTADGSDPSDRARKFGYDYCIIAENIAYEFSSIGFSTDQLANRLVTGWENSPEHRKNMLDPDVSEIGVAVAYSQETGRYYGVQVFGRPKSQSISFQIANRTRESVHYTVGERNYDLPPGYTMTHQACRAPELRMKWSANQKAAPGAEKTFHLAAGAKLIVRRSESGQFEVEQE